MIEVRTPESFRSITIMITDFTKEHPDRTLWRFWIPMMFSVMFQQIYNIADSMIAGKFAGEDALAAVGASYPITIIFMAFAVGMNLGASVVVSRLFGAGDRKGVKRAVTTAFVSSLGLAAVLTVFGYFFSSNMMESLTLSLEKSMSDEALISSSEGRASIVSKLSASARTAL